MVLLNLGFSQDIEEANNSIFNNKVTLSVNSLALDKVFDLLSNQTGCYFTYNADEINGNKLITIHLKDISLHTVLDSILENPDFSYKLINNQIVILPLVFEEEKKLPEKIEFKIINGIVKGADSKSALPFASLSIKNNYFGGITNEHGFFSLKIPSEYSSDTLVFSYMGYFNHEVAINEIEGDLVVVLQQGIVSLQEVIIRSADPLQLIKKAKDLFSENYFNKPYNYEAFYRESVKKSTRYMIYSEALLNGYKPSFINEFNNEKVELIKARKFTKIQQTDTLLVKLRGGLEACFQLDMVHQIPDFLADKSEDYYDYFLRDIIVWHNELVYAVDFKQKYFIKETLFEGVIYISVKSTAIIGSNFSFSKEKLRKTRNLFVVKKSRQVSIKPLLTNYEVSYDKWNGKYYTKHVRGELSFKAKKQRQLIRETYAIMMEMVYTQIDTLNPVKPLRSNLLNTNTVFSDSDYVYDIDFWKESTIINPEEKILDALKSSGFKLQRQD